MIDAALITLVPKLSDATPSTSAQVSFDIMSGALIWSDETLDNLTPEERGCLRALLRYRTGLITNDPDERFKELWDKAKVACPQWIGFSTLRCQPSAQLTEFYEKNKSKTAKYLKRL